jgi:thiol:disulfide interchange protein DsbD
MDGEAFADSRVRQLLQERYVIVALYTDEKTELPASEQYASTLDGKLKKTLGQKNLDYLMTTYKVNAMPYFAALDSNGNQLGKPVGYVGTEKFLEFLEQGRLP